MAIEGDHYKLQFAALKRKPHWNETSQWATTCNTVLLTLANSQLNSQLSFLSFLWVASFIDTSWPALFQINFPPRKLIIVILLKSHCLSHVVAIRWWRRCYVRLWHQSRAVSLRVVTSDVNVMLQFSVQTSSKFPNSKFRLAWIPWPVDEHWTSDAGAMPWRSHSSVRNSMAFLSSSHNKSSPTTLPKVKLLESKV